MHISFNPTQTNLSSKIGVLHNNEFWSSVWLETQNKQIIAALNQKNFPGICDLSIQNNNNHFIYLLL